MSKITLSNHILKIETNLGEPLVALQRGDNKKMLAGLPDQSVSCIIQDEPYGFNPKDIDLDSYLKALLQGQDYKRGGGGLDGKKWDCDLPPLSHRYQLYRVLKSGGYAVIFTKTQTVQFVMLELQKAGFEIVELLAWIHNQGMPKVGDHSYKIKDDPTLSRFKNICGDLSPSMEIIILAQKPIDQNDRLENLRIHGTGYLNLEQGKIDALYGENSYPRNVIIENHTSVLQHLNGKGDKFQAIRQLPVDLEINQALAFSKASTREKDLGLENENTPYQKLCLFKRRPVKGKNHHGTVKPLELMRYLVKLVSFEGDIVLDSYAGSSTTGLAAILENRRFIGAELMPDYFDIASRKLKNVFTKIEPDYFKNYQRNIFETYQQKISMEKNEFLKLKLETEMRSKIMQLQFEIEEIEKKAA